MDNDTTGAIWWIHPLSWFVYAALRPLDSFPSELANPDSYLSRWGGLSVGHTCSLTSHNLLTCSLINSLWLDLSEFCAGYLIASQNLWIRTSYVMCETWCSPQFPFAFRFPCKKRHCLTRCHLQHLEFKNMMRDLSLYWPERSLNRIDRRAWSTKSISCFSRPFL